MTNPSAGPKPWYSRRLTWIITGIVIVVLVAAIAVPALYARSQNAGAPAALTETTAPAETATGKSGGAAAADLDGTWKVGDGSQAGYRVDEVLNGQDVTVVGRTEDVTGSVTIAGGKLTAGTITVDLTSVKTDEDRRDNYFTSKAIDTSKHPNAVFTVTKAAAVTGAGKVEVDGTVEINGVKKNVTVPMTVSTSGSGLKVTGSTDVTWKDYGVSAPSLGFVKVEDSGSIEFSLALAQ